MKLLSISLTLILFLFCISGCGSEQTKTITVEQPLAIEKFHQLQKNMTHPQVLDIVGPPTITKGSGNSYYIYEIQDETTVHLFFTYNRLEGGYIFDKDNLIILID